MERPEINSRIFQLVDFYTNGSVKKFAEGVGIPQQTVNRLFNIDTRTGKFPTATTELLVAIARKYVEVDLSWLLTGNGSMLRTELTITAPPSTPEPPTPTAIYERDPRDIALITAQEETIASQKKTIAQFEQLAAAREQAITAKDEALAAKQEVIERDRLLAAAERKSTLYGRSHVSDAETTALDYAR